MKKNIILFLILIPGFLFAQPRQATPPRTTPPAQPNMDSLFSSMDRAFEQTNYQPTPQDEYFLGRAVAANILSQYRPFTSNINLTNYVNLICQTLVVNFNSPPPFNGYRVMILDSREFNAFATPGGHIFLTRGLIEAAPSEDALASVIAHELAHIMLGHGSRMIQEMQIFETADELAALASNLSARGNNPNQAQRHNALRDSINEYVTSFVRNGYSADQEFEADMFSLRLLAAAGYSPNGLIDMLTALQRVQSSQRGGFNSTHPTPQQRLTNVSNHITRYQVTDTTSSRTERFNRVMGR